MHEKLEDTSSFLRSVKLFSSTFFEDSKVLVVHFIRVRFLGNS